MSVVMQDTLGRVIASVAAILLATSFFSQKALGERVNPQQSERGSYGFLKLGMPLSAWYGKLSDAQFNRLEAADRKIVRAYDCLKATGDSEIISGTYIDWNIADSIEALEVCLFRVAAELQNPEGVAEWFHHNGFNHVSVRSIDPSIQMALGLAGEGRSVSGGLAEKQLPISIAGWIWFLRPYGLSVSIRTLLDGSPYNVSVIAIYQ